MANKKNNGFKKKLRGYANEKSLGFLAVQIEMAATTGINHSRITRLLNMDKEKFELSIKHYELTKILGFFSQKGYEVNREQIFE